MAIDLITRVDTFAGTGEIAGVYADADYASLSAAVTSIGATPGTLRISTDLFINGATCTVPATLTLEFVNGARLLQSGSGTVTFQGIGILDPLSQVAVFSGFSAGQITWTGNIYPARLSINLWDTGNTSLSTRISCADSALLGKKSTIVCYPSTSSGESIIDATAVITEFHELFFTSGEYTNTIATWGNTYRPPFLMQDNTSVRGSKSAIICESSVPTNAHLISADHMRYDGGESGETNTNIFISDLYFKGHPDQIHNGSASTILLGNCINGSVTNCVFDNLHAYTVVAGGYGPLGNCAENVNITDNMFLQIGTQVVAVINGRNIRIGENTFDQRSSNGFATYALIDIEPNWHDDVAENITIENNFIDARAGGEPSWYLSGIAAQAAAGVLRDIIIRNNTIIGADINDDAFDMGSMTVGINVIGAEGGEVSNNYIQGGFNGGILIDNCRYLRIGRNTALQSGSDAFRFAALASSDIDGNILSATLNSGSRTNILETEEVHTVTTLGSTVTKTNPYGYPRFYPFWQELMITINATDYVVATVNITDQSLTTVASIGTLAIKTAASATDVNTGADTITLGAHNFVNGCRLQYTEGTAAIGGLTNGVIYFVVGRTATTIQLALILGGAVINLTSTGTGTQTFTPILITKFSSNTYAGNKAADGIVLEPTGTSVILGVDASQMPALTGDITSVAGTVETTIAPNAISFNKLPDILLPSLVGRINASLFNPVTWQNMVGVSESGADNKLTKTAATNIWGNGGASSVEICPNDGYLELTVTETTTDRMAGVTVSDIDLNYPSIEYAFYLNGINLSIYESGANLGSFGTLVASTTVLKIERIGTQIKYYKDGSLLHTSTVPSVGALRADTSFYTIGSTVGGIKLGSDTGDMGSLTAAQVKTILNLGAVTTFANIGTPTPIDGDMRFVSDGTSPSNPLTGGGTGCMAIRQNGQWKGL